MAKRKQVKEVIEFKAANVVRRGWLAYLGAYGVAFDRAKPVVAKLTERYSEFFGELVEKGEEIEATAKEQIVDARDRAKSIYGAGVEKLQGFAPQFAANDRDEDVTDEARVAVKKVAAKARKTTRAVKRAVKAAA